MEEGGIKNKTKQGGFHFLLQTCTLHPSNNSGHKWENPGCAQGEKGQRPDARGESTSQRRDTEGSLLPTSHHQCPSHMLGSPGLSNQPRGPGECGHSSALSSQGIKVLPGADNVAEGLRVRGGGLSSIPCGEGRERGPFLTPTMEGCLEEEGRGVSS